MAGVGFELKKIFRDNGSVLNSLKGYSVTAVVTEGPMILTMVMLFSIRSLLKYYQASFREQEIYLFTITYVLMVVRQLSTLLIGNQELMRVPRVA